MFESISSTNLTIKTTSNSLSNNHSTQKSISRITRTISPLPHKQQQQQSTSRPKSREQDKRERSNSATASRRQERGTTAQPHAREKLSAVQQETETERNELKHVFARLQSKSVAQKLKEHLQEEQAEEARPAREDRGGRDKDVEDGSTSTLKSEH